MPKIAIIIASIRDGRKSDRVALYFKKYITENKLAEVDVIDLKEYNFPVFEERLQYLKTLPAGTEDFVNRFRAADGILIVTPEYNGGYPASLKNVVDLLTNDWKRKPVAISTVSSGDFAGSQVITSLQFTLWKIGTLVAPAMFPVPRVEKSFDENGIPADTESTDKRSANFIKELLWTITAKVKAG